LISAVNATAQGVYRGITIGEFAREALHDGAHGEIYAVFDNSIYLRSSTGAWACLLDSNAQDGPLHVRVTPAFEPRKFGLRGTSWDACNASVFTPSASVALRAAQVWIPEPLINAGARRFISCDIPRQWLMNRGPALNGLLGFGPTTMWPASAQQAVRTLQQCLCDQSETVPTTVVEQLLGAGPGLTPTGDDVLAGAVLALHTLRPATAVSLAHAIRARLHLTHPISAALLSTALRGQCVRSAHEVLAGLISGELEPRTLNQLDQLGATSGWDLLAGMLTVTNRTWS
jgi:hypothetical protein